MLRAKVLLKGAFIVMSKLSHLCSPIKVGNLTLKNRMITTSMAPGKGYATEDGQPTPLFLEYLEERAAGGLALILQSVTFFPKNSQDVEGVKIAAYKEEHIPGLQSASDVVHKHGSLLAGQAISLHKWRKNVEDPLEQWGPSDVRLMKNSPPVRVMTQEDIHIFTEQLVQCAKTLKAGGWDAIEVLSGVGSTLSRFMSPATNKRTDEYGGSLENRCRFTVECIQAIRAACGPEFPVLVRWSPIDFIEGGNELQDAMKIVPLLEKAGAAYHNLQVGWHESSIPLTTKQVPDGHWSYISAEIKKAATIPVVTAYRETDPVIMEKIIAEGKADLIGGARYSIADPEFARKVAEDRIEDISMCLCCCRCLDDVVSRGLGLEYCSVNPRLGPELMNSAERTKKPKKVLIAGSGPGGLAAAVTAYRLGHDVTVYERGPRIGGCLTMSAIFNPMYERLTRYYKTILRKNPQIKIRLNTPVTAGLVEREKPDAVIIAVGGHPKDLKVSGTQGGNIVRSHDFLELLNGKPPQKPGLINKFMWNAGSVFLRFFYSPGLIKRLMIMPWPFGKRVAIIGGGLPGCELASEFLHTNREMMISDENKKLAYNVSPSERFHVMSAFKKTPQVKMEPSTKVQAITEKGVKLRGAEGEEFFYEADTVAITLGFEENMELAGKLRGKVPILKIVGDCQVPARMPDATKAGYRAAMEI